MNFTNFENDVLIIKAELSHYSSALQKIVYYYGVEKTVIYFISIKYIFDH